jgi:hypothetical protein
MIGSRLRAAAGCLRGQPNPVGILQLLDRADDLEALAHSKEADAKSASQSGDDARELVEAAHGHRGEANELRRQAADSLRADRDQLAGLMAEVAAYERRVRESAGQQRDRRRPRRGQSPAPVLTSPERRRLDQLQRHLRRLGLPG